MFLKFLYFYGFVLIWIKFFQLDFFYRTFFLSFFRFIEKIGREINLDDCVAMKIQYIIIRFNVCQLVSNRGDMLRIMLRFILDDNI